MEDSLNRSLPVSFGQTALSALEGTCEPNADYWRLFLESGPTELAPNLDTRCGIVGLGSGFLPVTVNEGGDYNSYPCSLLTQYVRYPLGEMRLLKGGLTRLAAWAALKGLGALLEVGHIDRVVQWNSWLLSTNLLPPLSCAVLHATTETLLRSFPRHAVLVKNIHGWDGTGLPELFLQAGYSLFPSRKIYFFEGKAARFLARSNVRQDLAALQKLRKYEQVEHHEFSGEDVPRIVRLYEMLYLEKHSRLNPMYTPLFVKKALEKRLLEFRGLRHASGRIDAVFACFRRGGVLATPFVGYDTALGHEPGFYRLLVAMLLKRVAEEGMLLNYSSGAGDFKRRRGGEGCIEFNAIYTRHLPLERRLPFLVLEHCANQFGRRFLSGSTV
jgi:hypothetical protein